MHEKIIEVIKFSLDNERKRVLANAATLARELESIAKSLRMAAEAGDLNRISWTAKSYDVELATRATVVFENLHLVDGLMKD